MTLDDRLDEFAFNGYTKMGLTDKQYARQLDPAKLAILSDLEKLIEDNCIYGNEQENKAELLKEVRKYCE